MRIYIKNYWLLPGSNITDELGNELLKVKKSIVSVNGRNDLYDLDNNLLFTIRLKLFTLLRREAYINDEKDNNVASVVKPITFLRNRFIIESSYGDIRVEGDFIGHHYDIYLYDTIVGSVRKNISLRDSFVLTIEEFMDFKFYTALVIAIDEILDSNKQ